MKKNFHFIGIGGAGMAPLAYLLHTWGYKISGSDITRNAYTEFLEQRNIRINCPHKPENLPDISLTPEIVFSSAIQANNPELRKAKENKLMCVRRGELLAKFASLNYIQTIAVNGSHGKTTISAMTAYILKYCGYSPGFCIGGKARDFSFPAEKGNSAFFVAEVDESDGTNVFMRPYLALIPNIDDDHAWTVGGKEKVIENFKTFAFNSKHLIYIQSPQTRFLSSHKSAISISPKEILRHDYFSYIPQNIISTWPDYQKLNAAIAIKGAEFIGIPRENAEKALVNFQGVERRMTCHLKTENLILIEDYAHHPAELKAVISALRKLYPDYCLTIIFQPHRYARLKYYFNEFVQILGTVERVFITPVFAAWTPNEDINSEILADAIGENATFIQGHPTNMAAAVLNSLPEKQKNLLAIIGAGNIDKLIKYLLKM